MKKKWKMTILILAAVIAVGGIATYLFPFGPFGNPVLATVNGEKISVALFREELGNIDPAARPLVEEAPSELLDILINRSLLLQQAKKEGFAAPKGGTAITQAMGQDAETATIMAYLDKKIAAPPPVAPEKIQKFYEAYKDRMGGRNKEEAAPLIIQMIEQQRRGEEIDKLIAALRRNAAIDVNQKELQKLAVVPPGMETQSEEDFRKALTGGRPMVVDFGSNSCIPCRQLRPVLQKVRKDFTGKLEVLIIDIRNNEKLASDYQIRIIPTVVFFDPAGKEVFRHQGFMSEEKVKEQLAKLGVV